MKPASARVVGSAIVVFLPGDVTDQDQEDVCNSLELSYRAAQKECPEFERMKEWEMAFSYTLTNTHWFQQSIDIPERFVEFYNLSKEMDLSAAEQKIVEDAIGALASKSENSNALELFNDRAAINRTIPAGENGKTQARYMIVVCSVKNGAVAARFTTCHFSTFLSDGLFPQFRRDAKVRISASTRGLNSFAYTGLRKQIVARLEDTGISMQSKIMLPSSK